MLRNPPAGDWLMIRRNYQAWSHSPLTDITPANVGRLRMVWQWAMNEGGASEPTPIVHNGIIYLYNTGNLVQALDGRTGNCSGNTASALTPSSVRVRCGAWRSIRTT